MHKAITAALLAGLFLCAGCFTAAPPPLLAPPAPQALELPKAPPPVRPESVNEGNYRSIPQQLREEMDHEEQENLSRKQWD